jgi:hypothetical protein
VVAFVVEKRKKNVDIVSVEKLTAGSCVMSHDIKGGRSDFYMQSICGLMVPNAQRTEQRRRELWAQS